MPPLPLVDGCAAGAVVPDELLPGTRLGGGTRSSVAPVCAGAGEAGTEVGGATAPDDGARGNSGIGFSDGAGESAGGAVGCGWSGVVAWGAYVPACGTTWAGG